MRSAAGVVVHGVAAAASGPDVVAARDGSIHATAADAGHRDIRGVRRSLVSNGARQSPSRESEDSQERSVCFDL